jgi:hypothetical protein
MDNTVTNSCLINHEITFHDVEATKDDYLKIETRVSQHKCKLPHLFDVLKVLLKK